MTKSLKMAFLIAGSVLAITGALVSKSVHTGPVIDENNNINILNAFNETSRGRDGASLLFLLASGVFFTPLWIGRVDRICREVDEEREAKSTTVKKQNKLEM